jgi:hypothetical protein
MNGEVNETINYEIEFDFNEDVIAACQSGDKLLVRQIANQYWDFSVRLLNLLHKSGTSHFDPSIHVEKVIPIPKFQNLTFRLPMKKPSKDCEKNHLHGSTTKMPNISIPKIFLVQCQSTFPNTTFTQLKQE